MLLPLLTAALLRQGTPDITEQFGFEATSLTYDCDAPHAEKLVTAETDDEIPRLVLTNDRDRPNTKASGVATFALTWYPPQPGAAPPSVVFVTIGRNYSFKMTGTGVLRLTSPTGFTDTMDAAHASGNDRICCEPDEETYKVELTPDPDGTAAGELVVPTSMLEAEYDSAGGKPTEVSEIIDIEGVHVVAPAAPGGAR